MTDSNKKEHVNKVYIPHGKENKGSRRFFRRGKWPQNECRQEKCDYQYQWVLSHPLHRNDSLPASDMVCQVETASRSDRLP